MKEQIEALIAELRAPNARCSTHIGYAAARVEIADRLTALLAADAGGWRRYVSGETVVEFNGLYVTARRDQLATLETGRWIAALRLRPDWIHPIEPPPQEPPR